MLCSAQSKQNQRQCKRHSVPGAKVCASHGGNAPQVRRAAQVRLAMAADTLMAELLKIAASSADERVRLAAVNSALDRAGLGAKQQIEVAQEATQFDAVIATIMRRAATGSTSNDRQLPPSPSPENLDADYDQVDTYDSLAPLKGYASDDGVVVDLPIVTGRAEELACAHDRERLLAEHRPATTRSRSDEDKVPQAYGPPSEGRATARRRGQARRQFVDAGEAVPGNTPVSFD